MFDQNQVIFNDVSGALDSDLERLLLKYPNIIYVFSHNRAPSRFQTQEHMKYISPNYDEDLLSEFNEYFEKGKEWFKSKGIKNPVWFDPCFGFSKDYQQNLDLLKLLPQLIKTHSPERIWLLGISKKSFLRKLVADNLARDEQIRRAEQAHSAILASWMRSISKRNQLVIRVHDLSLFQSVNRCNFLYEV
jgi:dihydropteroate synthase